MVLIINEAALLPMEMVPHQPDRLGTIRMPDIFSPLRPQSPRKFPTLRALLNHTFYYCPGSQTTQTFSVKIYRIMGGSHPISSRMNSPTPVSPKHIPQRCRQITLLELS